MTVVQLNPSVHNKTLGEAFLFSLHYVICEPPTLIVAYKSVLYNNTDLYNLC